MPERAETYTHGHAESVLRSHRWRTVDNSAAYLAERLTSGTEVLDVGCGPGTITIDIARRVAPARVLGLDAAADVIAAAQSATDAAGVTNLELATGDVYALDLADDSYDVVHAHQVLQHE
jgi:ubiquinone/menaquinone biosynthesis C-methylase UbiE